MIIESQGDRALCPAYFRRPIRLLVNACSIHHASPCSLESQDSDGDPGGQCGPGGRLARPGDCVIRGCCLLGYLPLLVRGGWSGMAPEGMN